MILIFLFLTLVVSANEITLSLISSDPYRNWEIENLLFRNLQPNTISRTIPLSNGNFITSAVFKVKESIRNSQWNCSWIYYPPVGRKKGKENLIVKTNKKSYLEEVLSFEFQEKLIMGDIMFKNHYYSINFEFDNPFLGNLFFMDIFNCSYPINYQFNRGKFISQ